MKCCSYRASVVMLRCVAYGRRCHCLPIRVSVLKNAYLLAVRNPLCTWALVLISLAGTVPPLAKAQKVSPLDPVMMGNVLTSAFHFLEPRTLEPHTSRTFSLWGLDGLSALDPALTIEEPPHDPKHSPTLRLDMAQSSIAEFNEPAENDVAGWVGVVVSAMRAAWDASGTVRTAGHDALVQSFFDELFNHLDPYSRYIGPSPAGIDRTARSGSIANVGLTVQREGTAMVVSAINANGPAWAVGVNIGQRLVAVDGRTTHGQDADTVAGWLEGPPHSVVRLTLADPGRHSASVRIERALVPPQTVYSTVHGHLVVLRITSFSSETAEELSQYLDQALLDRKLQGVVFDLRGDRGGVLQQAVTASALVLDNGVAVVTKGRDPKSNHIWAVQGGDMTHGLPIAILVDGRTASAAEIMAAALADHRRAVVVGSSTLGKGLVQAVGQMPDGGELFVTWSRVLAPLGWPLQGLGVMPQICTSRGESAMTQQLQSLRNGTLAEAEIIRQSRSLRFPVAVSRILDIRRNCPAAIGTDMDFDAARTLLTTPASYHAAIDAIPDDLEVASP